LEKAGAAERLSLAVVVFWEVTISCRDGVGRSGRLQRWAAYSLLQSGREGHTDTVLIHSSTPTHTNTPHRQGRPKLTFACGS